MKSTPVSMLGLLRGILPVTGAVALVCLIGCDTGTGVPAQPVTTKPTLQHILFVGDSFTHGRYLPVRTYNNTPNTGGVGSSAASSLVVDENYGTNVAARQESASEYGPWGGIPGIFAELALEVGLPYDVHIEAISATTLSTNYSAAQSVIAQPLWNSVVLQDASFEPITYTLSRDHKSNPQAFCNAVQTVEQGIHTAAPNANVYLYSTWAPADTGYLDATANAPAFSSTPYLQALNTLTAAYHDVGLTAASQDGHLAGVVPVGDAWAAAWTQGVANPNPYDTSGAGPYLTFNYQPGSQPSTVNTPTDAGFHHPSIYGAYLSGLVLFQKITGTDVRTLGASEKAAASLGVSGTIAMQLQEVAYAAVAGQSTTLVNPNTNPCSQTQ